MAQSAAALSQAAPSGKLKVFLSYSRKDGAFAQELLAALELLGFEAYLDKEDIAPGEPWEDRLGNLIRLADTVVFTISPNSLASKHCAWEVEETARAAKRLVPIMLKQVPDADVPERLRKLNYVFFTEGQSFSKGLSDLARALRADAEWIREHSRYADMAARWSERLMPEALLLRGSDLDDARLWLAERPKDAPEILASQQAFVATSVKAAEEALRGKARLRWRMQIGLALASLILAGLAIFSGLQWQSAEKAKLGLTESNAKLARTVGELERAKGTLATQNASLEAANARLDRRLALRSAPLGNRAYDVPAGWFQVATSYAGAVAFVESADEQGRLRASGVIVGARQLNPRWPDEPVFLTATYVVAKAEPGRDNAGFGALDAGNAALVFYGPKAERLTARLSEVLWQSAELGVSVSRISGALPKGVTPIARVNVASSALAGLARLARSDIDGLYDDAGALKVAGEPPPVVIIGNLQGREEMALSISHLLGILAPPTAETSTANASAAMRSIDVVTAPGELHADLIYTHATLPGSGGSPIFDAATGALIGIHLISYPCPGDRSPDRRCAAAGTSLRRILAETMAVNPNR